VRAAVEGIQKLLGCCSLGIMKRRVAVTGIGVVSALGLNFDQFLGCAAAGGKRDPADEAGRIGGRSAFLTAAEVQGFDPSLHF